MMHLMISTANDATFAIVAGLYMAIGFVAVIGITAIIEAIDEKRAARKRRKYGKRYTVEFGPERRY